MTAQRNPRGHWLLLALLLFTLAAALLLNGYSRHEIGRSGTGGRGPSADEPIAHPLVYDDNGRITSRAPAAGTVALTFDDGPDPTWTPRVLDQLRRAGVPGTFFVVGTRAAAHPGLVRAELANGQVASHTFTHTALDEVPRWRARLELSLEELVLAGGSDRVSAFLRPPYSSTPAAVTRGQQRAIALAARDGYVVVLSDLDSEDWRRPGVAEVVRNATSGTAGGKPGVIVLFHDGGGDRAQTVAALPQVIQAYRDRGYRFVTVAESLGVAPSGAQPRADTARRVQGRALLVALKVSHGVSFLVAALLIPFGVLAVARLVLLVLLAGRHRRTARQRFGDEPWYPPVAVLVPAYNEAVGIAAAVRSLDAQDYPNLRIVVIDDGSTDGTAEIVRDLGLDRVEVIEQPNAGKAAALTRGLQHTTEPVLVMVDGDTLFAPDALRWLVQPLRDPTVGAVSGNTKVGNRRRLLGRWQHLEYVIGFNLDRRAYDLLRCMPTVPGAIGAFRREAIDPEVGVPQDTLAEDTDLTMSIVRAGWHVVYEERAHANTEAPSSLGGLWKQRYRWCYGTLQAVWKHRAAMLGRSQDRRLGFIGLPYLLLFQVLLPLLAPLIDVYALYGLLFLDARKVAAYWLGFLVLQVLAASYALVLDRESLRVLWALPLQQFVYRQLMYLVVIESVVSALRGHALGWHKLERTGLESAAEPAR